MTKKLAEQLFEISANRGHSAHIYENYSGRGMYGKETYGIVVDSIEELLTDVINELTLCNGNNDNEDEDIGNLNKQFLNDTLRSDSMGRQVIIY